MYFFYEDADNYWAFIIQPDRKLFSIYTVMDKSTKPVTINIKEYTTSEAIKPGGDNVLRLSYESGILHFLINDQEVYSMTVSSDLPLDTIAIGEIKAKAGALPTTVLIDYFKASTK